MISQQSKIKDRHFEEFDQDAAYIAYYGATGSCRLVRSYHWASEGYWLEYPPYKNLSVFDHVLDEKKGV